MCSLSEYALSLQRKDLQVLVGLLTGHAELNWHLTLVKVKSDALYPLSRGGGNFSAFSW